LASLRLGHVYVCNALTLTKVSSVVLLLAAGQVIRGDNGQFLSITAAAAITSNVALLAAFRQRLRVQSAASVAADADMLL